MYGEYYIQRSENTHVRNSTKQGRLDYSLISDDLMFEVTVQEINLSTLRVMNDETDCHSLLSMCVCVCMCVCVSVCVCVDVFLLSVPAICC